MASIAKKVIVFGAHGKVGQNLIQQISKTSSLTATAVVRNQEQAKQIANLSSDGNDVKTQQFTLDAVTVDELSKSIKGHDVVVFAAGSGGKDLFKVDLDGAVRTFEASQLANVKRYIMLSALHADKRELVDSIEIRDYYIAKHYADRILVDEFSDKLDFTILRPGLYTDGPETGKIGFVEDYKDGLSSNISRADVAKVILETIGNKYTYGKTYDFVKGNLSISDPSTFK